MSDLIDEEFGLAAYGTIEVGPTQWSRSGSSSFTPCVLSKNAGDGPPIRYALTSNLDVWPPADPYAWRDPFAGEVS